MIYNLATLKTSWLFLNIFMVILMVIIGGITRLTDSGLSMTEWKLISGIIPPLTQEDWNIKFELYKQSPEFLLKNFDISLSEFKKIFFWEYFHRIWGRLIGITFFIPFLILWYKKQFSENEKKYFCVLLILGCFQGFMGWFMVESGLVNKPDVSHFRLSAHLVTAFVIYALLLNAFWNNLNKNNHKYTVKNVSKRYGKNLFYLKLSIFMVFLTISSGAFVSGTNAGWAYNNFPYMGDNFLPPILLNEETKDFNTLFNDIGFLQFFHRILATLSLIIISFTLIGIFKNKVLKDSYKIFTLLLLMIFLQYALGIIALITFVPLSVGLAHQLGSLIVLTLLIISLNELKKKGRLSAPNL